MSAEIERAAHNATVALSEFDRAGVMTVLQTVPALAQTLGELLAAVTALSSPPADDVREALALAIDPNALEVDAYPWPLIAADRVMARFDVRPRGTVTPPVDEPRVLSIVAEIVSERGRQDAKWGEPRDVADGTGPGKRMLGHTFADLRDEVQAWVDRAAKEHTSTMSTVLLEEVFEALAESDEQKLRAELIQVAAVAAKWIQIIDARDAS